ncbi:hypothetical protein Tco_0685663 [Tanacetum coccineum]
MSSSTITYTSISSDSDLPPWGFHLMDPAEFEAPQSPEHAPPSSDYAPGPKHRLSSDYVPGLEYPEYVATADDEIPIEDQPLHADASPTTLSPSYVANFDPSKEDLEEDPADYPTDGRDDDEEEESSKDDDEEEEDEASEEDKDKEEEHLALADFKTVRLELPMAVSTEILIAEFVYAPTPLSPPPSPLSPLSSPLPTIPSLPLHTSPTYADAPLGYRAAMIQLRATSPLPVPSPPLHVPSLPLLLPSADHWANTARQTKHTLACRVSYEFIDTVDASIQASDSRAMTAIEEVNERVTDLATTQTQDAYELYVHDEDIGWTVFGVYSFWTFYAWRLRDRARTRDAGHQDGPADAGSSCYPKGVADAIGLEHEANCITLEIEMIATIQEVAEEGSRAVKRVELVAWALTLHGLGEEKKEEIDCGSYLLVNIEQLAHGGYEGVGKDDIVKRKIPEGWHDLKGLSLDVCGLRWQLQEKELLGAEVERGLMGKE